jgi:addiction module HigA family antidote
MLRSPHGVRPEAWLQDRRLWNWQLSRLALHQWPMVTTSSIPELSRDSDVGPLHPGMLLRNRVLPGLHLSVSQAARELRVARQTLHRVLAGTAAVSPEMAVRLARLSGTRPDFWLGLQQAHDLWRAERALASVLEQIPTHPLPKSFFSKRDDSAQTRN